MQVSVQLPKAFSVRDDHEFYPFQHLLGRMNPKLTVSQVATGRHRNGGCTVFWGVVYHQGSPPTRKDIELALSDAGFDVSTGRISEIPSPAQAG